VTVRQGREQSTVDEAGERNVIRSRIEAGDPFPVLPLGPHVQAVSVQAPASVAMGEIVWIEILEGCHIGSITAPTGT
jgi:hypothetical protein